ncbi:MAG: hypothetical protein ABIN48_04350 [Ginsengibacter sp.]
MPKKQTLLFLSFLIFLTACPKEPIWYNIFVINTTQSNHLKIFINPENPGDSLLPLDKKIFDTGLKNFNAEHSTSFRICMHKIRGIRDCIESQPGQKIFLFVFDADTLATYDYSIIREEKRYKERVEIPYTMATNRSDLRIEYP